MYGCRDKTLDVFMTGDGEDADEFIGPVWSVELFTPTVAMVVNKSSQWVTFCTIPTEDKLNVGDQVRIGLTATEGHTGLCTVMEKVKLRGVRNGVLYIDNSVPEFVEMKIPATPDVPLVVGGTNNDRATPGPTYTHNMQHWYAYKLNFGFNLTLLSGTPYGVSHLTGRELTQTLLEDRHTFRHSIHSLTGEEQMYYPMYKVSQRMHGLSVKLDASVRKVNWIRLMGYSVFAKRQIGFQEGHAVANDDWVAMYIDGLTGDVLSNNNFANGAFAVLHVGGQAENQSGAIEFHTYDPDGLATLKVEGALVRGISLKFADKDGHAANLGRVHLWLKVCVSHA